MKQVWNSHEWENLMLENVHRELMKRAENSPKLGDLTVRDLCCLARAPWSPVGIYVFTDNEGVLYTGKTHGRSFHERMLSHIDHRDPIPGSPHLAQLVQSMVKKGAASCAGDAVEKILDMKITWLPVPRNSLDSISYKQQIALTERRLLWSQCLDPRYNSPRVKRNDSFMLAGNRHYLSSKLLLGEPSPCK
jgi:hypothetical protein